jgi:hypothetical protein
LRLLKARVASRRSFSWFAGLDSSRRPISTTRRPLGLLRKRVMRWMIVGTLVRYPLLGPPNRGDAVLASATVQRKILQVGLGVLVAGGGNAVIDLLAFVAAYSAGGARGCDVDLDSGGRFAVLMMVVLVYPAAYIVIGGLAAGLSAIVRPAPAYWAALGGGWVVLTAASVASVFYPGC